MKARQREIQLISPVHDTFKISKMIGVCELKFLAT